MRAREHDKCNENCNDNNTGHIDACILVIICVVVNSVFNDVVLKKFGNPGLSFLKLFLEIPDPGWFGRIS